MQQETGAKEKHATTSRCQTKNPVLYRDQLGVMVQMFRYIPVIFDPSLKERAHHLKR